MGEGKCFYLVFGPFSNFFGPPLFHLIKRRDKQKKTMSINQCLPGTLGSCCCLVACNP
ncbi:hypothetical protein BD408DRAFT_417603 [Parasitella parasitica]|nr:hypothetical protein BD408DRAFT_417603 [Parasitella parasitica]